MCPSLKLEKKLIVEEGMTVDYVKQHGTTAQKYAIAIFDANDDGIIQSREADLFNNCQFKYNEKSGDLTIYDNELRNKGYGGTIVIKPYNGNSPHPVDQRLNPDCPDGFYQSDIVNDDIDSYGALKYEKNFLGNRRVYSKADYDEGSQMYGFDRMEIEGDSTKRKSKGVKVALSTKIYNWIDNAAKKMAEHDNELDDQKFRNAHGGGFY